MPNPQLSILAVDDTKFSSAMIGRALNQAGYQDVRLASSASEAIAMLEARPANVLLADWLMPEMDGLQLTERVRQNDESADHYTYIILLTGKEGENVQSEAFDRGVDDFITKSSMTEQLLPRVYAADRICATLQRMLQKNRLLAQNNASLEQHNLVDPLTTLGNPRYLRQRLGECLRQLESRGGAMCYLLISLEQSQELRSRYGEAFYAELLQNVARRLQQLMRPLDVLARMNDNLFSAIALLNDLQECTPSSFKRLHDGLNLKAFKTSEGFISLKASISLVGLDNRALPIDAERLHAHAKRLLPDSQNSGRVAAIRLSNP